MATTAVGGRQVVTYDQFGLGDYGLIADWEAPAGSYKGKNVHTYIDGSVGPRCGLVDLAPTGLPTGEVVAFGHNESLRQVWFIIGDTGYQFPHSAVAEATQTLTGAGLTATPTTRVVSDEASTATFLTVWNDTSYTLNHALGTLEPIATSPGGRTIAVYGDRLMIGSLFGAGGRVQFSAASDFSSWPVTNYFDVGYGYEIDLLVAQRQYLAIGKHDGSLWILSGVPGVSDYLRHVVRVLPIDNEQNDLGVTRWGITADGTIWFVPAAGEFPAQFNGSVVRAIESVTITDPDVLIQDSGMVPKVGVTGLVKPADVFFATGGTGDVDADNRGLLFQRGRWSRHVFDADASGYVDGALAPRVYMTDGGSGGVAPKFYAWPYLLDRPPFADQTFESLGDGDDTPPPCEFRMPEWWAKDDSEVRVRSVIVDFKKWGHGFAHQNQFTIEVAPLRRFRNGDGTIQTYDWSEASASSSASGERDRVQHNFGPQYANGFRVGITGIVGVAVQKISVVLERRPIQGIA